MPEWIPTGFKDAIKAMMRENSNPDWRVFNSAKRQAESLDVTQRAEYAAMVAGRMLGDMLKVPAFTTEEEEKEKKKKERARQVDDWDTSRWASKMRADALKDVVRAGEPEPSRWIDIPEPSRWIDMEEDEKC